MLRFSKVQRELQASIDFVARMAARSVLIGRTPHHALVLLALLIGACDSAGAPEAPDHDVGDGKSTASKSSRDAGAARARDAGRAKDDDDEAEASGDEVDPSATADPATDPEVMTTPARRQDAGPGHDAGSGTDAGAAATGQESCATLTYQSFGKAFVEKYCTECHNSTTGRSNLGGIALDTLPVIMMTNRMLLKRAVIPRTDGIEPAMPKGGDDRLTDAERTKFGAWVDCGLM